MNKSYKSVWNESTGSWVAVSELATGRSKSKRAKTAISKAILTQIAVGGMSLAGAGAAMADNNATLGTGAVSNITDGVAIGVDSEVDADPAAPAKIGGIAIGDSALSMGSGVAVGQNSQAGTDSLAFGSAAQAANGGTAIGANSYTINAGGVAIGQASSATGAGAMAIGMNSSATGSGSVALGEGSVASTLNTVSVGNASLQRRITNVGAGITTTDAVNLGQLTAAVAGASNPYVKAIGANDGTDNAAVSGAYGVAVGAYSIASGIQATAVGYGSTATGTHSAALGFNAEASGTYSTALGPGAVATADNATALGFNSTANQANTVSIGSATQQRRLVNLANGTSATDAVNLGQLTAAGLNFSSGVPTNSFVAYTDSTKAQVTFGGTAGTKLSNVANGTAGSDAVNLSQLTAAGLNFSSGVPTNSFVAYTDSTKAQVTFGGTAGTKLSNVANGVSTLDAVNVGQLTAAGLNFSSGVPTNSFVAYTDSTKAQVTFGGTAGTKLSNVADGSAAKDAVNVEQLTAAGLNFNTTGGVTNAFVAYDNSGKTSVTLGGGSAGTTITNVKAGALTAASSDAVNGSQLYNVASSTAAAIGGTAALNPATGKISAPSISVGGATYTDLSSAIAATAALAGTGSTNGVQYDTTSHTKITMGGVGAATPVTLANVAAGVNGTDAVNMTQFNTLSSSISSVVPALKYLKFGSSTAQVANALGSDSLALGGNANAMASGAVAIGLNSSGGNANSVAIGAYSIVGKTALNSVALGYGSQATVSNTVSVGTLGAERTISNVAAGVNTTDAVNLGQVESLISGVSATKQMVTATRTLGASLGAQAAPQLSDLVAVGTTDKLGTTSAVGTDAVAIGLGAQANNDQASALGTSVVAGGVGATAVGYLTAANGANAVAIGNADNATGDNSTSIGVNNNVQAGYGVAIGGNNTIGLNAANSVAIGSGNTSTGANNVILGNNVTATGTNSVVLGANSQGTQSNVVSVGGTAAGTQRKIVNVAAGTTATDAVNLGQMTTAIAAGAGSPLAILYDASSKASVTFGGTAGTKLSNVANGASTLDAVNVGQLTAAGLIVNSAGVAQNSFVAYNDSTKAQVTFGGTAGTKLSNVANGTTTMDAVNLGQLAAAGIIVNSSGVVQNTFVAYSDSTKAQVTFGGTAGTKLSNVANGTAGSDAVNLSQLTAAGLNFSSGVPTNSFVAYTDSTKAQVTFGGTAGTKLSNVANGTTTLDAVNVGQLTAAGLNFTSGVATNSFVAYNDSTKAQVTFGGTAGTKLSNVANGTTTMDAVNLGQLAAAGIIVNSSGVVQNTFVAYTDSTKAQVTFGGTAGTKLSNVANGASTLDAVNVGQLTAAGLIVNSSGVAQNSFVAYNDSTKAQVTFGGTAGTKLSNVANGTAGSDAVNLSQLTAAGLNFSSGVPTNSFVAYTDSTKAQVTFGGTAGTKLSNVANGASTLDAVNVGQLTAAGLIVNSSGVAQNSFVAYNDSTKAQVTFGGTAGTKLSNVANGASTLDAVNVGQLTAAGLIVNSAGVAQNSFVAYNDSTKAQVTFGGTAGTKLSNVANGASTLDAVNVGQLTAAGLNLTSGVASNAFVMYDSTAKTSITLGTGTAGAQIHRLANGTTGTDAVNLSQLMSAGLIVNSAGVAQNSFVAYDNSSQTSVTLGKAGTPVKVTNVAAGVAPTDAVNMAQFGDLSSSISSVVPALKYLKFGASTAQVANALGSDSLALGGNANALASGAISIGLNSTGGNANAVAIGAYSSVGKTAVNSVALGYGSQATVSNTVSVGTLGGERTISNVAAGVNTTDAVNLGQVESLISGVSATKQMVTATRTLGASLGAQAAPQLSDLVAVGTTDKLGSTSAVGTDAVAIGLGAQANNDQASALGTSVVAGGIGATAVGYLTVANGANAVAIGNADNATGDNSTSIGVNNNIQASNGVGIGANNSVGLNAANSIMVGASNTSTGANNMVLGNNVTATGTNSVVLGANSQGTQSNVVSVGGTAAGTQRKIVNVAAGTTATDAVNLGQMTTAIAAIGTGGSGGSTLITQPTAGTGDILVGAGVLGTTVNFANNGGTARQLTGVANGVTATSAVNLSQLTPVVTALGGGATVNSTTGAVTGPTYNVQGGTQGTVGSALSALDSGVNAANAAIAAIGTGGSGGSTLITQPTAGGDILVGAAVAGTKVNFSNLSGTARELTGVANGTTATSAVNLSQLTPAVTALGGGASIAGPPASH